MADVCVRRIQAQYPHDVITTVRGQGYLFGITLNETANAAHYASFTAGSLLLATAAVALVLALAFFFYGIWRG